MKRIKLALEELDTNCDIQECPEDTTISDLEKDDQLISLQQDDLNQAEDISATIDTLTTNVDTATGLSDEAAQVLNVVTEHFCRRLGYKHPIVPALESFNDATRVQNTKLAIENLQKLNTQLNKSINLAQESLLDSIFESIVGVFSKEKELKMEVERLKEETKNKQVTVEEIPAKNWSVHFRTNDQIISGKDVLEITGKLKKFLTGDEVFKTVRELSTSVNGIKTEVVDTWFNANKNNLDRISEEYNNIKEQSNEFERELISVGKGRMKKLVPLTEDERTKILNDIDAILSDKEIDSEIKQLKKNIISLNMRLYSFLATTNAVGTAAGGLLMGSIFGSLAANVAAFLGLASGVPFAIALLGAKLIFNGAKIHYTVQGLKSDLLLSPDTKSFKLVISKTLREIEEIITAYRQISSERLKICSAALNYVKASTH